jgi:hypothetical protein
VTGLEESVGGALHWPELLRITESDTPAVLLRTLLRHGEQLLTPLGLSISVSQPTGLVPDVARLPPQGEWMTVSSEGIASDLAAVEAAAGEGPTLTARDERRRVVQDNLAVSEEWPAWRAAALARGVGAVAALPMTRSDGSWMGVIAGYTSAADPLPLRTLASLAAHAVVVLDNLTIYLGARTKASGLEQAMASSSVIEQAKGVLMMRERISADTAWEYLLRTSAGTRRSVEDIAQDLVSKAAAGDLR